MSMPISRELVATMALRSPVFRRCSTVRADIPGQGAVVGISHGARWSSLIFSVIFSARRRLLVKTEVSGCRR